MACVFREQFRNPRPEHTREKTLPKKIGKSSERVRISSAKLRKWDPCGKIKHA